MKRSKDYNLYILLNTCYLLFQGTAYNAMYPYFVLIFLMFLASVCALFLPETLHQKLPDTLADAHLFGAEQEYFIFPKKPVPKKSEAQEENSII